LLVSSGLEFLKRQHLLCQLMVLDFSIFNQHA
jgi:hypothetical protein